MFIKREFPWGWKEIKKLRSTGRTFEKKIRRGQGTLVLQAADWGWPCDYCGSKSYRFSTRELSGDELILGISVDSSKQTYCPKCKKTMTPKEYEKYILGGEYKKHN